MLPTPSSVLGTGKDTQERIDAKFHPALDDSGSGNLACVGRNELLDRLLASA